MPLRTKIIYFSALLVIFATAGYLAMQKYSADVPANPNDYFPECNNRCSKIAVICREDSELDYAHMSDQCVIVVPRSTCITLDINPKPDINGDYTSEVAVLTPEELKTKADCTNPELGSSEASGCCTLIHEIGHACDSRFFPPGDKIPFGDADNLKCTERVAEEYSQRCYNAVSDNNCDKNSPNFNESDCKDSCNNAENHAISKIYDNCMCEKSKNNQTVTEGSCCSCYEECVKSKKIRDLLPDSCQEIYDHSGDANNFTQLIKGCQIQISSSGTHNCQYYGGPELPDGSCSVGESYAAPCMSEYDIGTISKFGNEECEIKYGEGFFAMITGYTLAKCVPAGLIESQNDICQTDLPLGGSVCGVGRRSDQGGGFSYICVKSQFSQDPNDFDDEATSPEPENSENSDGDNNPDIPITEEPDSPDGSDGYPMGEDSDMNPTGMSETNNTPTGTTATPVDPVLMYQMDQASQMAQQPEWYQPAYWQEASNNFTVGVSTTYNVVVDTVVDSWQGMFSSEPPQEAISPQEQQPEPQWYQWNYWF